jgi:phosphoglycolate phosphatase-like HAD superfamily hydrolase
MLKKKFGFKKKQSIYIGDTEIDANLAKSFKIKFILIKNGYTSISHTNISSDFTVSNFTQISPALKKLS